MGGSVSAIENGFIQEAIAKSAYEYQKKIEDKSKIIVGVNHFISNNEEKIPGFKIDDSIQKTQSEKIEALKSKRNNDAVSICLNKLKNAASTHENIMPIVIEAVENFCTLGEIADTLRTVFGEYK